MNVKLTDLEFKKLLRKYTPQAIINMHCTWKINLTSAQIDKLIKIRDENERRDVNEKNTKSKTKRN